MLEFGIANRPCEVIGRVTPSDCELDMQAYHRTTIMLYCVQQLVVE